MLPPPLDRAALRGLQLAKLQRLFSAILPANRFYARKLGRREPPASLEELQQLPFTTKTELLADQATHPPYGTNLTYPLLRYVRLHQTSGTAGTPLRWLDTPESWQWFMDCWRMKYDMVGLGPEDRLFFPFSFGPFIGFWAAFEAATRRGNFCLAGGGMTSHARIRMILDHGISVVLCTPTYALRLVEAAKEMGIELMRSAVRMVIVAGEPGGSIPSVRRRIEEAWGARVFDHAGMTEIGSLMMECKENPGGLHVLETECIAEVIEPASGRPVDPGQEGELVLTNLGRWGSPLIRYRTGDRVAVDAAPCPCGRVFARLGGGILGRADDMMVIRGNNVYPSTLEEIIRRFPGIAEFALEIDTARPLTVLRIRLELEHPPPDCPIAELLCTAIRDELHFRPEVVIVPPGTLPRSEMKSRRVIRRMEG